MTARARTTGERGAGTVLVSMVILLVVTLTLASVAAGLARARVAQVQGAADLAALAGAAAQWAGRDACDAAAASAGTNGVHLAGCSVAGDEVEFVVSATVEASVDLGRFGDVGRVSSRAHAGVVTGAVA